MHRDETHGVFEPWLDLLAKSSSTMGKPRNFDVKNLTVQIKIDMDKLQAS